MKEKGVESRLHSLEANVADHEQDIGTLEQLVDRIKGDLKNAQSQINDLILNEGDMHSRISKAEAMIEGAIASAIRPLVKEFVEVVKWERRSLAEGLRRLLEGEEIE